MAYDKIKIDNYKIDINNFFQTKDASYIADFKKECCKIIQSNNHKVDNIEKIASDALMRFRVSKLKNITDPLMSDLVKNLEASISSGEALIKQIYGFQKLSRNILNYLSSIENIRPSGLSFKKHRKLLLNNLNSYNTYLEQIVEHSVNFVQMTQSRNTRNLQEPVI